MGQAHLTGHDPADAAAALKGLLEPPPRLDVGSLVDPRTRIGHDLAVLVHQRHVDNVPVLFLQSLEDVPQCVGIRLGRNLSLDQGQVAETVVQEGVQDENVVRRKEGQPIQPPLLDVAPEQIPAGAQGEQHRDEGCQEQRREKIALDGLPRVLSHVDRQRTPLSSKAM